MNAVLIDATMSARQRHSRESWRHQPWYSQNYCPAQLGLNGWRHQMWYSQNYWTAGDVNVEWFRWRSCGARQLSNKQSK